MSSDETRPITTDLGFDDPERPGTPSTGSPSTDTDDPARAAGHPSGEDTAGPGVPAPVFRRGPAPFALLLGVLGLAVAVGVLVGETVDLAVDWSVLGPWTVVAGGLLVVVVGLLGLRSNRDGS